MKLAGNEFARYIVNGLVATAVHYGVLTLCLEGLQLPSAGLANFLAALCGTSASFLGNRHFVFRRTDEKLLQQGLKFFALYGAIAVFHGLFLWLWTDRQGLDYRLGFLLATAGQLVLSFVGNKWLVFKT